MPWQCEATFDILSLMALLMPTCKHKDKRFIKKTNSISAGMPLSALATDANLRRYAFVSAWIKPVDSKIIGKKLNPLLSHND